MGRRKAPEEEGRKPGKAHEIFEPNKARARYRFDNHDHAQGEIESCPD
jgi:hypothetical protein